MVKALLSVVLALFILTPVAAKVKIPFQSIQPFQRVNDDGILTNVCTAFSINKAKGLWVTAGHCAEGGGLVGRTTVAEFVFVNEVTDIAVFKANSAPALKVADKAPRFGDEVFIVGYPYGALDPIVFYGRVSSPLARLNPNMTVTLFNMLGLPGDSGSPVINKDGDVVAIGQHSTKAGAMYGTPWEVVRAALMPFVD